MTKFHEKGSCFSVLFLVSTSSSRSWSRPRFAARRPFPIFGADLHDMHAHRRTLTFFAISCHRLGKSRKVHFGQCTLFIFFFYSVVDHVVCFRFYLSSFRLFVLFVFITVKCHNSCCYFSPYTCLHVFSSSDVDMTFRWFHDLKNYKLIYDRV